MYPAANIPVVPPARESHVDPAYRRPLIIRFTTIRIILIIIFHHLTLTRRYIKFIRTYRAVSTVTLIYPSHVVNASEACGVRHLIASILHTLPAPKIKKKDTHLSPLSLSCAALIDK